MQARPFWSNFLASVGAISRRPSTWRAGALAATGSALVAGTWLVAQLSWQARLRTLEAELGFYRSTRQVDVPRLLSDLQRLAGPAADRLALQELKQRQAILEREHKRTLEALASLRRSRRLEERFTLTAGSPRQLLEGKLLLVLEGVEAGGARVSLAGAPASLWRPGDFRDLNFGGGRYRLSLEAIPAAAGGQAEFRLDALVESPGASQRIGGQE
ncbi:MAG: hypothetical protein ACK549_10930 [Cyanobacteriota bacterium]